MAMTVLDMQSIKKKYAEERAKRLRPDGNAQYQRLSDKFEALSVDPHTPFQERAPVKDHVTFAFIGAGFSGLVVGARLKEAGIHDVRLIDKAGGVGGTWYWNRYPGARCDTAAMIYLPLLEETGYIPTEKYVPGPEIRAHCERIAHKYGLHDRALFHTEVKTIEWQEQARVWQIKTDRGDDFTAKYLGMGTGPLHVAKLPGIPGIETFRGKSFHTSRWDYDYTGGNAEGAATSADAQIVTDGSVGAATSISGPNYAIPDTLGSQVGGNLFHSFQSFSVPTGATATFSGPTSVNNVISRVTGGSASTIEGIVTTSGLGSAASFYFINPAGIVVSGGGAFNVPGALYLSTANQLNFADNTVFRAATGGGSTLSLAQPASFGFLATAPAASTAKISLTNSTLQGWRAPGGLVLLGGDVEIRDVLNAPNFNSLASAPSPSVFIGAVGRGNATVDPTNPANSVFAGQSTIAGSRLIASVPDVPLFLRDSWLIYGGDISISNSRLEVAQAPTPLPAPVLGIFVTPSADIFGTGRTFIGQGITLNASGALSATDSVLATDSGGGRLAGQINLSGPSVTLNATRVSAQSLGATVAGGAIQGAPVTLTSAGALNLVNGSRIVTTVSDSGAGGDISLSADTLLLDNSDVRAEVLETGRADGGDISVTARTATLVNDSILSTTTNGSGIAYLSGASAAGDITVKISESLTLSGLSSIQSDSVKPTLANPGPGGLAGDVHINAANASVSLDGSVGFDRTAISSNTSSNAPGGAVTLSARDLTITGGASILASTVSTSTARSGNVAVDARSITMNGNGSSIIASSFSAGDAGSVNVVTTGDIRIQNSASIESQSNSSSGGEAGSVTVTSGGLLHLDRGRVSSASVSTMDSATPNGPGVGRVSLTGATIAIDNSSVVSAAASGSKNAGSIDIRSTTGAVTLGSTLGPAGITSVGGTTGAAGSIAITASTDLTIGSGVTIRTDAPSPGTRRSGNISLQSGGILQSLAATITSTTDSDMLSTPASISLGGAGITTAGTAINSRTSGAQSAGSVTFSSPGIVALTDTQVQTSTSAGGAAAPIVVTADQLTMRRTAFESNSVGPLLVPDEAIGRAGDITVDARVIDIDNLVSASPVSYFSAFRTTTSSAADAGRITLGRPGASITIRNADVQSSTAGNGRGGDISVTGNNITLSGSQLLSGPSMFGFGAVTVTGSGAGGDITVAGGNLTLDRNTVGHSAIGSATLSSGDAGNIVVALTGDLVVRGQSVITADTIGSGEGGAISIRANAASFDNGGVQAVTTSTGGGGAVTIQTANDVQLSNNSSLLTVSLGSGAAGSIQVNSRALLARNSQIAAGAQGAGAGGAIQVTGNDLTLDNASISSGTIGAGAAGAIQLMLSDDIELRNGAFVESTSSTSTSGTPGRIDIGSAAAKADEVRVLGGSSIATTSFNANTSGNITVYTRDLVVDGAGSRIASDNQSRSVPGGAGSILIDVDPVTVSNGGTITTNSELGRAGDITIRLPRAGVLLLTGKDAPGVITTSSGANSGGRITISNPLAVISNGGEIRALGQAGGANVSIMSDFFISSTDRTNLLAVDGVLVLDSQVQDVTRGSDTPDPAFVDASRVLRGRCETAQRTGSASALSVLGTAGPFQPPPKIAASYAQTQTAPGGGSGSCQ